MPNYIKLKILKPSEKTKTVKFSESETMEQNKTSDPFESNQSNEDYDSSYLDELVNEFRGGTPSNAENLYLQNASTYLNPYSLPKYMSYTPKTLPPPPPLPAVEVKHNQQPPLPPLPYVEKENPALPPLPALSIDASSFEMDQIPSNESINNAIRSIFIFATPTVDPIEDMDSESIPITNDDDGNYNDFMNVKISSGVNGIDSKIITIPRINKKNNLIGQALSDAMNCDDTFGNDINLFDVLRTKDDTIKKKQQLQQEQEQGNQQRKLSILKNSSKKRKHSDDDVKVKKTKTSITTSVKKISASNSKRVSVPEKEMESVSIAAVGGYITPNIIKKSTISGDIKKKSKSTFSGTKIEKHIVNNEKKTKAIIEKPIVDNEQKSKSTISGNKIKKSNNNELNGNLAPNCKVIYYDNEVSNNEKYKTVQYQQEGSNSVKTINVDMEVILNLSKIKSFDSKELFFNKYMEMMIRKIEVDSLVLSIRQFIKNNNKKCPSLTFAYDKLKEITQLLSVQYKKYSELDKNDINDIGLFMTRIEMLYTRLKLMESDLQNDVIVIEIITKRGASNQKKINDEDLTKHLENIIDEYLGGYYDKYENKTETKEHFLDYIKRKFDGVYLYSKHSYISSINMKQICEYMFTNLFYYLRLKNPKFCETFNDLKFIWSPDSTKQIRAIVYETINNVMKTCTENLSTQFKGTKQKYIYDDCSILKSQITSTFEVFQPQSELMPFLEMFNIDDKLLKSICLKTLLYNMPDSKYTKMNIDAIKSHQFNKPFLSSLMEMINLNLYNYTVRLMNKLLLDEFKIQNDECRIPISFTDTNEPKTLRSVLLQTRPLKQIEIDGIV